MAAQRQDERDSCSHACKATRSAIAPLTTVVLVAANAHCDMKPQVRRRQASRKKGRAHAREVNSV